MDFNAYFFQCIYFIRTTIHPFFKNLQQTGKGGRVCVLNGPFTIKGFNSKTQHLFNE